MSQLIAEISISLDGFAAGPNQSMDNPLGEGAERLHEWVFPTASWRGLHGMEGGETGPDDDAAAGFGRGVGAYIMGRNMFGPPGGGEWDESWRGWWGEDPPYHVPVFVLTHHPRDSLPMEGGTTFHFVTDGIESALEQARAAADGGDVKVIGGATAIQQYLKAGLLEELQLHIAPVVLGAGERLFDDVGDPKLEQVEVVAGLATHVTYRVG
ncbi:MAG TPA: dihydrofolate reductase family protein [Thermoleophilaceae bacterium]|nr:dihydrofolate reductase family protein [Thermoleophilaceae bacterium]